MWSKGIAYFGAIKRDADRALINGTVIGDVCKRKARYFAPCSGVKNR